MEQDSTEWLNSSNPQALCDTAADGVLNETGVEDPEVVEALSGVNVDDTGILQEDALEYLAGYIIRKQHLHEHEDSNIASFTWVDQVSKGFLKKPSAHFLNGVKCLEAVFHTVNSSEIARCRNIKQHLLDQSIHVDLPENVKRFFFKCRIFFRVRHLNKRLKVQKAKHRMLRYKKLNKITL